MLNRTLRPLLLRAVACLPMKWGGGHVPPRRVLVIRPDHLGDILFTVPALKVLRGKLPRAEITFLVGEWAEEAASHNPYVDQVLTCRFPWFDRRPKGSLWGPYRLLLEEAERLRGYGFDGALNLRYDFWWGAMLAYLAGIPHRVGYGTPECRPFLTQPILYVPGRHEVEQNLTLVREFDPAEDTTPKGLALSLPKGGGSLEFPLALEEEDFGESWLSMGGDSRPLVALHPGAGAPVKLWPAEKFAQLGDSLTIKYGARILVTGGEGERELVEEVAARMGDPPLTLVGDTLGQLAAVLRRCALVVGADSGVLHLAVALGVPTVHLYGPVSPRSFGPWGDPQKHRVVLAPLPCVPCHRLDFSPKELDAHPCVRSILVEDVLAAMKPLLEDAIGRTLLIPREELSRVSRSPAGRKSTKGRKDDSE